MYSAEAINKPSPIGARMTIAGAEAFWKNAGACDMNKLKRLFNHTLGQ